MNNDNNILLIYGLIINLLLFNFGPNSSPKKCIGHIYIYNNSSKIWPNITIIY